MKVAIIGAGICGLYLAWKLAEKGYQVIIFERKEKIGKEVCSGLFSERILEFIPQSQKLIENQIDHCLIHFPKKTLKINFQKKFLVMSHFELDNLVAKLAQKAGAKIILSQEIKKEDISKLKNDFARIIGCDGATSVVRKTLRLPPLNFRLGIQGFFDCYALSEREENWAGVETWPTKSGFIWKIPRKNETEYGIMELPKKAKEIFDEFLAKNNLHLEKVNSAIIPHVSTAKFWWGEKKGLIIPKNQKIILCGDALGLTKPWSGGGVMWGLMTVDILLKNFPDFLKTQKEIQKFFLSKIIFSKMVTKAVYFLGFNFVWLLPREFKIEGDFLI